MTHSLHRCGKAQELDYVWLLYHVKGINDQDLKARISAAADIAIDVGTVNWGDVKSGPAVRLSNKEIKSRIGEKSRIRGAFTSKEQVEEFLRRMKQADMGLCVIVSGLLDEVLDACGRNDIKPHTINYSLGVFGKKELLADEATRDLTCMCGHHMVPDGYVRRLRARVRKGKTSPEKAAMKMAVLCPCGIFNQYRATELLKRETEEILSQALRGMRADAQYRRVAPGFVVQASGARRPHDEIRARPCSPNVYGPMPRNGVRLTLLIPPARMRKYKI